MNENRIATHLEQTTALEPPSANGHAPGKAPPHRRGRAKTDTGAAAHDAAAPSQSGQNGNGAAIPTRRDANGKFLPGNKGGPGNPYAREVARLRSRLMQGVSDGQFDEMVDKLVELAVGGDVSAAKLLLSYLLGKPTPPPVEPDKLAVHEAEVLEQEAGVEARIVPLLERAGPELPLDIIRDLRPRVSEHQFAVGLALTCTPPAQHPALRAKMERMPSDVALQYARKLQQRRQATASAPSPNGKAPGAPSTKTPPARSQKAAQPPSPNGQANRAAKALIVPKALRQDKRIVPRF